MLCYKYGYAMQYPAVMLYRKYCFVKHVHARKLYNLQNGKANGIWATVTLGTPRPTVVLTPSLAPTPEQSTTGAERVVWPDERVTTCGMAPRSPNTGETSTLPICTQGEPRR